MPEGLLLVVWSSTGLSVGSGRVEESGPTDNADDSSRICVNCAVGGMLPVTSSSAADCDDVTTTYRCSNQRCIARHLVNNSVNDCLDNSDEGEPFYSAPASPVGESGVW